jgi:hypothetical protein
MKLQGYVALSFEGGLGDGHMLVTSGRCKRTSDRCRYTSSRWRRTSSYCKRTSGRCRFASSQCKPTLSHCMSASSRCKLTLSRCKPPSATTLRLDHSDCKQRPARRWRTLDGSAHHERTDDILRHQIQNMLHNLRCDVAHGWQHAGDGACGAASALWLAARRCVASQY